MAAFGSLMIHLFRAWLPPLLCGGGALLGGFFAFHPGWKKAAPLIDGTPGSFQRAAEKISKEDLLENAAPHERVSWLLEICRQPDGLARDHALYVAIQRMKPGDFLAAIADLRGLGDELIAMNGTVRAGLIEASMERWLGVDKEGALRWLAATRQIIESGAINVPPMGSHDLGAAYRVLAAREPEWLREQIAKLGPKTQRRTAICVLMSAETERDPKKARAWLETFRGSKEWGEVLSAYLTGLSASDPGAAMNLAQTEDGARSSGDAGGLAANVFLSTAMRSPSLAAELLPKLEPKLRQQMMLWSVFYVSHSGADPFEWFADRVAADPTLVDLGSNPEQNAEMMLRHLVVRDPQRTLDLIPTLPEAQREVLREGALAGWAFYRPDTFLDWLMTQPPEALPKDFKSIGATARQEPDRFARWVATLPPGELRERSQVALATALAKQGRAPDALLHFPETARGDAVDQAAREIAASIGTTDPGATAQWVATLPAGRAQAEAARGLVFEWAAKTPQAASAWVETLPAGSLRDAATGALAGKLAEADPESATEWVEQISEPAAREVAVRHVFQAWARTDAGGSRAWLRECAGVSDVVKERLLRSRR